MKKSKKGKKRLESSSGSHNSSLQDKLESNEDESARNRTEMDRCRTGETELPSKFTVLLVGQHPHSKNIKTRQATFLRPSILRAFGSSSYFYMKGKQCDSLIVAYPLRGVKDTTVVLPNDPMGFEHEEEVTLHPLTERIKNALAVTVVFDEKVYLNEKLRQQVLEALLLKRYIYAGSRLKCLSFDESEFTVTCISQSDAEQSISESISIKLSELSVSENLSKTSVLEQKFDESMVSQFSAMSLENVSHQSGCCYFQYDSKMHSEQTIIPTFFTVDFKTSLTIQTDPDNKTQCVDSRPCFAQIGGLQQELKNITEFLNMYLHPKHPNLLHVVGVIHICGPSGTGKSLILESIENEIDANVENLHWCNVYGRSLQEGVKEVTQLFKRAKSRAPSIILIDNFNHLVPSYADQDVISSVLAQEIEDCLYHRVVFVIATNDSDYDKEVLKSFNILIEDITLQLPDTDQREDIIMKLLEKNQHTLSPENMRQFASYSHGFTGKDLKDVIAGAAVDHVSNLNSEDTNTEVVIAFSNIMVSLVRRKPSVTQGEVRTKKVKWDDIGGMANVKKDLKDIVEGPLTYPDIYKRFRIKPPRGILLYGPPGCSKTMIAKALATECDYNFISKNLSDIHNKYVGESEKAVSALFAMARKKAPCIVFLDEIDALLPSRGSCTGSGVEERVVNVFLQEIDGIEELNNVIVVAATNRPDRIDEAFLRYGRISRHIYVPLPCLEARVEILKISMRKRSVASDFDYQYLAHKTEGYSGAEIVNLCNEAAFQVLYRDVDLIFRIKHFELALQDIPPRTDKKLLKLYEKFNLKYS